MARNGGKNADDAANIRHRNNDISCICFMDARSSRGAKPFPGISAEIGLDLFLVDYFRISMPF